MKDIINNLLLAALVIGTGVYFYQRSHHPAASTTSQPLPGISENYQAPVRAPPAGIPAEAWKYYEDAKEAVYNSDLARAEKDLAGAVRVKPDFTEAWYNLGATQANIAIDIIRHDGSESAAVRKFREGVDSKKKARELMIQGKWFEYQGEQRTQTRYDVEQALEYADETLANEPALIDAMRMWAGKE